MINRPSPRRDAGEEAAGVALFRLVRMWNRQSLAQVMNDPGHAGDLPRILVVQAVSAASAGDGDEVTVGTVAAYLQVDPSTASRAVNSALRAGYLHRRASQRDGRRIVLDLTDAGRKLLVSARRYQQAVFDEVTQGWSAKDRDTFAGLLVRFVDSFEHARGRLSDG